MDAFLKVMFDGSTIWATGRERETQGKLTKIELEELGLMGQWQSVWDDPQIELDSIISHL